MAALDLGEAYSGVAISDPGASLARPLEVVSSGLLEEYLCDLLAEESVREVVVGVPKTLAGEAGFQAERVFDKLRPLKESFPEVCFVEWDERLTTRLARSSLSAPTGARPGGRAGRRRKGRTKERVDHLAAAVMLQEYLDHRRGEFEAARQGSS
ncbi:MAG: Holliday junction resolvase RuvX [Actinobacteria bacterium]|nr:Holliday junction resolvase RuvX [Actinomycetota bacterium]